MNIDDLYKSFVPTNYDSNERYYRGDNVEITDKNPERKPDNRVPTAFVKVIVDTMVGYDARPGNITYTYDNQTSDDITKEDEEFTSIMGTINKANNEPLHTSEEFEETVNQGESFEITYTVESKAKQLTLIPKFLLIPKNQFLPIYTTTADKLLIAGVWFRKVGKDIYATHYTAEETTEYIKSEGATKFILATPETGTNPTPNIYGVALINEYVGNRFRDSFWQPVKATIDAHDESSNKALNELERFSNAIMLLADRVDEDFVEKLEKMRVIDNLGDSDGGASLPRFLERTLDSDFFKFLTEHYEDLIYTISGTPNLSDPVFAAGKSGEAMKYKLIALEYAAAKLDAYFDQGLQRRFDNIKAVLAVDPKVSMNMDDYEMNIKHTRTLPPNLSELAEAARKLVGILSPEAITAIFPVEIVPDKAKELELQKALVEPFPPSETV